MKNRRWALTAQYRPPPLGGSRADEEPGSLEPRGQGSDRGSAGPSCFSRNIPNCVLSFTLTALISDQYTLLSLRVPLCVITAVNNGYRLPLL